MTRALVIIGVSLVTLMGCLELPEETDLPAQSEEDSARPGDPDMNSPPTGPGPDEGLAPDADFSPLPGPAELYHGLVAIWSFDRDYDAWALDRSGNGHHGRRVFGHAHWAPDGRYGGQMLFPGNDHINAGPIDIEGDGLTLAAWCYIGEEPDQLDRRIVSKSVGSELTDHFWMLSLNRTSPVTTPSALRMRVRNSAGTVHQLTTPPSDALPNAQWIHVAGTYDGVTMRLYIDGRLVDQTPAIGNIAVDGLVPALIGANHDNYAPWYGALDEVAIFSRALSDAEVDLLMRSHQDPCGGNVQCAEDGCCVPGCTYRSDSDCPICDSSIGMVTPMVICSEGDPCDRPLAVTGIVSQESITTTIDRPTCATAASPAGNEQWEIDAHAARGRYDDGEPIGNWTDADGTTRYHCLFTPPDGAQRPLVIFIPSSDSGPKGVYNDTLLRTKAESYDLYGDGTRPGFVLAISQGRNLHWPTAQPQDGRKHDIYHRDLSTESANRDIAFIDHLIDSTVASGSVDPARIYLMGWSNGAQFAALYGIARHGEATTPGGNRVAAVAVYSGGDPFENVSVDQTPSCRQEPYPVTELPYYLLSKNCDAVVCNAEHAALLDGPEDHLTPGNVAETWIETLRGPMQNPNVEWGLLDLYGADTTGCLPLADDPEVSQPRRCHRNLAMVNHVRWPDGVPDGITAAFGLEGEQDREGDMLEFLGRYTR